MDRIKIDRRILLVETLGCIAFIAETIMLKWEFWVIPIIALGIIALWYVHVSQRMTADFRLVLYFIFGMVQVFFHGVHETSMFDIAVVSMLFMVTFSLVDKLYILNAIFVEFLFLVATQIYLHYGMDMAAIDKLYLARFILHIGAFICMFIFCRISVSNRNADKAKLEKREQEIKAYDTDMEDFLSNVSHELRTPVNVVNGMTTLFLKSGASNEVSAIKTAGVRLQYQIEDIQDYTEIKRGELALEEEKYMSTSLVNDVVVHFNLNERHNELDLVVDLDPDVPSMMKGDIRKIHKLFRHLLDNAIKFTKAGGIYIHVFMVKRDYGINLAIEVTDTGIGMTRDEIAHVSKGMYQANKKRNRSTGGIGIGLAIVYGFVHKMGGFVKIDSHKGEGTTVRLSIPQEVVNPMPCLMVVPGFDTDVVFYVKPEKYQVPQLREFYKSMAVNLATGLKVHLFSAGEVRELRHLVSERNVSHVFTGQEEYEADAAVLEEFAESGINVTITASPDFKTPQGSMVHILPKPLYGLPVVKTLNTGTGFHGIEDEEKKGRVSFPNIKTLIVDDEPMNLVVATGLFRDYRMDTETAESGTDAINKYIISEFSYDLIFMDHMMPEMDGVETMRRIRHVASDHGRHPIIVALTANALSGAREMFIKEGFDGFIAKPIDINDFERVMKKVLPANKIVYEGGNEQ